MVCGAGWSPATEPKKLRPGSSHAEAPQHSVRCAGPAVQLDAKAASKTAASGHEGPNVPLATPPRRPLAPPPNGPCSSATRAAETRLSPPKQQQQQWQRDLTSRAIGDADGVGDAAEFYNPRGIVTSPDGGALFVADWSNHKIRRVEVATGAVTILAGSGTRGREDGVGDSAEFYDPTEVALSPDGSTLFVGSYGGLRLVCVAAPPPPPSFAPIVVPRSTLGADFAKTRGDASLPQGMVTFLVGDDRERIEHVSKNVLCARSPVFRTMFGIGMKERDAAEVTVSHTNLASFTALIDYLLSERAEAAATPPSTERYQMAQMTKIKIV
ncbi:hypothetical protein EMIHUDRAFT_246966 [Emiliania huxleyi CCMP1516]|uniref:BTB domain-containing protein n=2 Tax=Emiliania huxleyi TaxID=2903 RepID=A0A0D3IPY5_EMIH1|nr:hypothetical protein EMIHUDRAFT_246966 [Emiliania huxleyi CCMP1516]EOD13320.1 hypothetical protein EMIHUDRAFT_246966 [Emiliania huxleyi CCMP1516]|eukprot:XP_005765749.1 hypothetical protein EMIHUDRAFT_246966 [Emiliania huxleyi CCMP1516]